MDAANALRAGEFDVAVAGGMESMSNAPYYLPKGRAGLRMGHGQIIDGMISDGLWDPYKNVHMGNCAELCAAKYSFTREAQDAFALESYQRARRANEAGDFKAEIAPVTIESKKGAVTVDRDEEPFATPLEKLEKMGTLKPAFQPDGSVTAANSSKINDGASALVLVSEAALGNFKPIARIVAQASHAQAPEWFTTAPVAAARKAAEKAGIPLSQIDLFEVNEAFAVVAMAFISDLVSRPEQGERERRSRRPRPSDRLFGVAHRGDAHPRAPRTQEEVRPRLDLHRGRRGHRRRRRSALESGR